MKHNINKIRPSALGFKPSAFSFNLSAFRFQLCAFSFLLFAFSSNGQSISINENGTAPDSSAMLDVSSIEKGLLIPRMTFSQRTVIAGPATGLVVYQSDGAAGFYYNAGTPAIPNWVRLVSSDANLTEIADSDNDTKIQVEETANDDIIRFDNNGSEYFNMNAGRLNVLNTGNSVFIGDSAGINDDLTTNNNIFIGKNAGVLNISGSKNTVFGYKALIKNTAGGSNVIIGSEAASKVNGGNANVIIGEKAGSSINGGFNVLIGQSADASNTSGSSNVIIGTQAGFNGGTANSKSGSIFIGQQSGYFETTSNKLYIENSSTTTPLLYGDFAEDSLVFNGQLTLDSAKDGSGYTFPGKRGLNGQVLTSNGAGKAIWNTHVGDNLGNHTATQNIKLNGSYLSNDGDNEGLHVAANGNVTVGNNSGYNQFTVWNKTTDAEIQIFSEKASTLLQMIARGTNQSNNITAFRSRGAFLSQASLQAGDDIFTLNVQPFFNGGSSVFKAINISVDGTSSTVASTKIGLFTRSIGGANSERLTINDEGFVGVNNTNPTEYLDVKGNILLNGEVRTSNNGAANMIPIAYGNVNPGGTLTAGSNNVSVSNTTTGTYEITISGETYSYDVYITNVSIVGSTYGFIHTDVASGKLVVMTKEVGQNPTDMQFHFTVFKP